MTPDNLSIVRRFVARINAHDADGLTHLMTEDHRFVDAVGEVHLGREHMRKSWREYFALFADYRITVEEFVAQEDRVALFGWASGTSKGAPSGGPGTAWRTPAAWKALVRAGRVAEWRVYADVEAMLRSMGIQRW